MQTRQRFEKSVQCPTNESLLALLQSEPRDLPAEEEPRLIEHLATCEFCELTLELLRAHPARPVPAPSSVPPVPESLFHLFTPKPCHK